MDMRLALTGLALSMSVTGCALVDGAEAPDQIRLTGLEVAEDPRVDIRYPALLSYDARGDVAVVDSCFTWSEGGPYSWPGAGPYAWPGAGPYCFAPEGDAGGEAVRSMLVTGYAGTYTLEGYVRYLAGGDLRRSNSVATEITVGRRY